MRIDNMKISGESSKGARYSINKFNYSSSRSKRANIWSGFLRAQKEESSSQSPNKSGTPDSVLISGDFSPIRSNRLEPINRTKSIPKAKKNSIPTLEFPERAQTYTMLNSIFPGRPPTLVFDYPPQCLLPSRITKDCFTLDLDSPLLFRISRSIHTYNAVTNAFIHAGVEETHSSKYNVYISSIPKPKYLRDMKPHQKISHFPGIWQLGRKDLMWRNIYSQRRRFGRKYDICPHTYILPEDLKRLKGVQNKLSKYIMID